MSEMLRVEDLTKTFPGVVAVDRLSFALQKGEVLAVLGENGAGKSTLTKMISGVLQPDSGRILLDGRQCLYGSSHDAIKAGISMVYQELSMVGSMSIAENIFANRQPTNKIGIIQTGRLYRNTDELMQRFNLHINPRTLVKQLSMGQQQLIEILKAVSQNPKVLILDEPTSSLTEVEVDLLFAMIQKLKAEGMSFLYITHKLSEVFRLADRVMVMRDGRYIDTRSTREVNTMDLITLMVGREIVDLYSGSHSRGAIGEPYFSVRGLSSPGLFKDVSFSLRRGEILGVAGLVGAGRTEMARGIVGLEKLSAGCIELDGKVLQIGSVSEAIKRGIAYITEDRKNLGLYLGFSIKANLVAPSLDSFSRAGIMRHGAIDAYCRQQAEHFNVKAATLTQKIMSLSGGNQQKCLLSLWMGTEPQVLIFDEPTRGVDVGARSEIYEKIREYTAAGNGAVVVSSDLPELIGICDRIIVMYHGRVRGEVEKCDFGEENILALASGIN
ncbi:MAG: D-ribose transporter ATP-binding protein [candidate division NC10 bacterium]|nr:D-ribose transporter ATP-binding protein [candidate division NC10 bacterium]